MPMDLATAPDVFTQIIEHMIGNIDGVECSINGILIHASSKSKLEELTFKVIKSSHSSVWH